MRTRIIQHDRQARPPTGPEPPVEPPRGNLAARAGRWSATHWKTATIAWLAFVALAFVIGQGVTMKVVDKQDAGVGEARKADKIIDAAFGSTDNRLSELVIVQSKTKRVDDPRFQAAVADTVTTLKRFPQVEHLRSPFAAGNEGQISADRHAALIEFSPHGEYADAKKYIDTIVHAVAGVQAAHPGVFVAEAGVSTEKAVDKLVDSGIARAGLIAIPLTLAILLVVMGSLVAALVPVVLSLTAVFATF